MSKLTDMHNVQLTNFEIFVLKFILENSDVGLEQFERLCENQQEVQECEKLLVKAYKWQEIL